MFQRLLQARSQPAPAQEEEVAAVRAIVARLETMPVERARHLAGLAYVMSRAARADLSISDEESSQMVAIMRTEGRLDAAQALLVVEMARLESLRNGATADYVVTRDVAARATPEEKLAAIRCCFLVTATGGAITAEEANVVNQIARELGISAADLNRTRADFVDQLSAIQAQRRLLERG